MRAEQRQRRARTTKSQEKTERCREKYMRTLEKAGYERDGGPKRPGRARRRGEKYEREKETLKGKSQILE
jgi:hypothetical protein